jgi:type IV pilus assembly protein PilB
VPVEVVELVPESVARENVIMPFGARDRAVVVAVRETGDFDLLWKLEFILNRDVEAVAADEGQIVESLNRHYGSLEVESVDSILYEFPVDDFDPEFEV